MCVSPANQIYKCFSCGAGGDALKFMMQYHKMTVPEALRTLADRAGITLEKRRHDSGAEGSSPRQRIAGANARAMDFYRALLRHPEHGRIARQYIQQRGISEKMIEQFAIGYAPDRWDGLATMIREKHWPADDFEQAGLIAPRQRGEGHYDRLRHRLIFPILDSLGRPIAFGGRVLPDGTLDDASDAKYLNSPETVLFNKSATLYGIHAAKKPIIDARTAVIVEGYTDVIAAHQAGATNVVATLGTSLTAQHVGELRKYADKVVLTFDGDEAGHKAADRAVELFLTSDVDVAITILPEGLDPADLFQQADGLARWGELIKAGADALSYQLQRVRQAMDGAQTLTARQRLVEEYLRRLGELGIARTGRIRRAMVVRRLAELLGISEREVGDQLARLTPAATRRAATDNPQTAADNTDNAEKDANNVPADVAMGQSASKITALQRAERDLVGCLLTQPDLFHQTLSDGRTLDESVVPADITTPAVHRLFELVYEQLASGEALTLVQLVSRLAAADEHATADLATDLQADVERRLGDDIQMLAGHLRDMADVILGFQREQTYKQTRDALAATGGDSDVQMTLLRQLAEHRRQNPSAVRIAKLRGEG